MRLMALSERLPIHSDVQTFANEFDEYLPVKERWRKAGLDILAQNRIYEANVTALSKRK